MASFFGKIFFFCLNTKLGGIKNCPKKKFCKSDNFVIFENIDENVPSSSLWPVRKICPSVRKISKWFMRDYKWALGSLKWALRPFKITLLVPHEPF